MLYFNSFSNYVSNIKNNKLLFIVSVAFSLTTNYLISSNEINNIDLKKNPEMKRVLKRLYFKHYRKVDYHFKLSNNFSYNYETNYNNDNYKIIVNIPSIMDHKKSKIYWKSSNRTFKNNKNDLEILIENNNGNYSGTVNSNNVNRSLNQNAVNVIRNFLDENGSKIDKTTKNNNNN